MSDPPERPSTAPAAGPSAGPSTDPADSPRVSTTTTLRPSPQPGTTYQFQTLTPASQQSAIQPLVPTNTATSNNPPQPPTGPGTNQPPRQVSQAMQRIFLSESLRKIDTAFPDKITPADAVYFEDEFRRQRRRKNRPDRCPSFCTPGELFQSLRIIQFWSLHGIREIARQLTIRYLTIQAVLDQRIDFSGTGFTQHDLLHYQHPRSWDTGNPTALTEDQRYLPRMYLVMMQAMDVVWDCVNMRPFGGLVPPLHVLNRRLDPNSRDPMTESDYDTWNERIPLLYATPGRDLAHYAFNQEHYRRGARESLKRAGKRVELWAKSKLGKGR
ncbi:hypothetical protein QBC40DRAFT_249540 [Triangularia verruculosa]|uniref:Uncharacterized protein n=1 Tax=Triangularia verruculosa TaxID=2587418 RepID=A0AAN7AZB1_9PEZI|nr:hypothetical protein QBC40DRAFT_249540 [Triangularia verruculosa]